MVAVLLPGMFDVLTIGTATRDVFLTSHFFKVLKDPEHLRKIGFSEGAAECFAFGGKVEVSDPVFSTGGGATNTAVTFSRQGLRTAALVSLGQDENGTAVLQDLKNDKITPFALFGKKPTGYSTILLSPIGERTILVSRGASEELKVPQTIKTKVKANWIYVVPGAINKAVVSSLVGQFKKQGSQIAMNLSGHYAKFGASSLSGLLSHIDVLILNRSEAALLARSNFETEMRVLLRKLANYVRGLIVITDGAKGSFVTDGTYVFSAGIFAEKKLVDRTGAGDAFGSGFVAGIIRKENRASASISEAMRLGSANATAVVEQIGAKAGILTTSQLNRDSRFKKFSVRQTLL